MSHQKTPSEISLITNVTWITLNTIIFITQFNGNIKHECVDRNRKVDFNYTIYAGLAVITEYDMKWQKYGTGQAR